MYKKVLLTDKEIALLKRVIGDYMDEKLVPEIRNLQHIYSRLRDIKPTEKYVQSINQGMIPTNQIEIKRKSNTNELLY